MRLRSAADIAELLQISKSSFYRLVGRPGFPPGYRITERLTKWDEQEVVAWVRRQTTAPESLPDIPEAMRISRPRGPMPRRVHV